MPPTILSDVKSPSQKPLRLGDTDPASLDADAHLRADIRLLGRILGDTVRDQEGADVFDLVERIRQMSIPFLSSSR